MIPEEMLINLIQRDGIWYANSNSNLSYPKEGNSFCFQLEDESKWFQHRNMCILQCIQNFKPLGTFFDIGGGNGFVSRAIQASGIETVLIEPGIEGAINSKDRGVKNIVCSTLENLDIQNDTLGSIGVFDVVEHIENDTIFLQEIRRILHPKGRLYITIPALPILFSSTDRNAGHFRRYTVKSINRVLKNAGFKIDYSSYFFSYLILPIFIFRTIPSWFNFYKNDMKTKKKEHSFKNTFFQKLVNHLSKREILKIKHNKSMLFGSSIIVVARKS